MLGHLKDIVIFVGGAFSLDMSIHYFIFDLDLRSKTNTKRCPVMTYATAKFEAAMSNG